MNAEELFRRFIEPSADQIGLLGICGYKPTEGAIYKITKNVFTDFDGKLSRYLAAVSGSGLPLASVETWPTEISSVELQKPHSVQGAQSVPHALATAARLLLGDAEHALVRAGAWLNVSCGLGQEWTITKETIETFERALAVCHQFGTIEFLEISANFERVLVRPRESDLEMVTIDLRQGTIDIPEIGGAKSSAWTGSIFGFEKAAAEVPAVITYLGRAQHAVALSMEKAILSFRDAAETQIMNFDAALAGRSLTEHRLELATSLIARLKAGLGSNLLGLSETAQMTAFDWIVQLDETARPRPVVVS